MFKERINKLGKEQIENAKEIIICKDNAYFVAKYGEKQSRFDPDPYIAIAIFKNKNNSLISAGDFAHWRFENLKNAVRSIKRLNKGIPISIYSDDEIFKFVAIENAERKVLMDAVKKFNEGERSDLISILENDNKKELL